LIYEWKLDGEVRNFGDALYEVFLDRETKKNWEENEEVMYFPLGSVIVDTVIEETLDQGFKPFFLSCGWRGEPLNPKLLKHCTFIGARGPHTQAELEKHGINVSVTMDPGYSIPPLVPAGEPHGMTLSIRHIKDPSDYSPSNAMDLGADALFSPVVQNKQDILDLIEKISGARFVLAGSMHAAIIADAYKVPFALLSSSYIDCPPKWEDWLASININNASWVDNIIDGRKWHKEVTKEGK
jgi:hypothetical protein